jgi:hypothetical protein
MTKVPAPKTLLLAITASGLTPTVALAHHSHASYDEKTEVTVEGTVTKLDWQNPHIYLTLETKGIDGKPAPRTVEAFSVSQALAAGTPKDAIAPGAHVVIHARPARAGAGERVLGLDVTTDTGARFLLAADGRGDARPAAARASSLEGNWVPSNDEFRSRLAVNPNGPQLPFTEAGRAARAARNRDPATNLGVCEPFPPPWLSSFPDLRTIELGEKAIVMRFVAQGNHLQRVVHLDRTEHPKDVAPSLMGDSTGRWEGKTLVIDTVGFSPDPTSLGPSSPSKHLIERLTLADDQRHLAYEFTLTDPDYLAVPISVPATWDYRPDLKPSDDTVCAPEAARRYEKTE